MDHMEKVRQLRADTQVHYNCAQSVLVTFAKEMGLTQQQAYELGANFGSGMRCGSACGALTGALMVLGMTGQDARKATELLADEKMTLTEVAMRSGFQSISSFNRVFRAEKGMAPGEYRALSVK